LISPQRNLLKRRQITSEASKLANEYEHSLLRADGWGRRYHWQVFDRDGAKIIKITSDGEDGISQQGGGDDLYIEVTIPSQGPVATKQNTHKHSAGN
jgi:hypothetical protein